MATSDKNSISIFRNLFTGESIPTESPVKNWFLPDNSLFENYKTPFAAFFTAGFNLKDTIIHSILSSNNETEIRETDADGILTEFWFSPNERTIKQILKTTTRPLFINLFRRFGSKTKIIEDARKYESIGVSGIIINTTFSLSYVEKIRKTISIPIITKSQAKIENIIERYNAGADIIYLNGMDFTPIVIETVKKHFPHLPVISYAGNSKELIMNSLASGVNAIIFKPWTDADYYT